MSKKIVVLLLFLSFFQTSTFAQKLEFDGSFALFREAKTKEPVLIINDSLLYKGIKSIKIPFRHSDYLDKLQEYVPFNIKDKTYLVHRGCGPVLEFRNDSIVKINDAYLQHNQYDAIHFVYNNEIYFFGGYGLFTTKNILIKYNFKTKDWIEIQTRGEKIPEPRAVAYSYLKGADLYIFGGIAKDENNISNSKPLDNIVWRLHLSTMHWDCVGTYDPNLIKNGLESVVDDSRKLYFQGYDFLEFDYFTNKIDCYYRNYITEALASYIEGTTIIGVYKLGAKKFFHVGEISEFKGKLRSTAFFIAPLVDYTYYMATASISLIVLLVFLFVFRKRLKPMVKPFKGIVYDQHKQIFVYKRKPILIFDDTDKKILWYLLEYLNQYVSLNELNQLFENNSIVETISATVKRREQAVNSLIIKVSKITGIEEKDLLLERKNTEDKRIKDVLLLPKLLKIK